mmetsp:Transcript_34475/g.87552  ORF Transcript_34475/g.87552 Transcript_34475/m.87552 type:complete len:217 (-) Transcript_34475:274-924(-)
MQDACPITAAAIVGPAEGPGAMPSEAYEERTVVIEVRSAPVIAKHLLHGLLDFNIVDRQCRGRHLLTEAGPVAHVAVHQLLPGPAKVRLQQVAVVQVLLHEASVGRILLHFKVCDKHHQSRGMVVLLLPVACWAVHKLPVQVEQVLEVGVGPPRRRVRPLALESAPGAVALAESVPTCHQRHGLSVSKVHLRKCLSDILPGGVPGVDVDEVVHPGS